ncbi:PREDICTED: astacin-like metalloendopeptidase [Amphimedon queenslandica]|uniref:Metalloendopeptidase n=1 Tax=Amphimedon queenslandica TaxID=400682 RepID=A0AAN0JB90_AMPQE|nr:PREDICTED: astacin-like metalloendopeptidase [Amphimedon queenslandica]|eukprot:XP_019854259.1 PREDICTED: astacin-like metalloendopeptidase [Amphimedon queenslandica]
MMHSLLPILVFAAVSAVTVAREYTLADAQGGEFPEPELDENGIPVGMALVGGDMLIEREKLPLYEAEGLSGLVNSEAWRNVRRWPRKIPVGIYLKNRRLQQFIVASINDINRRQRCVRFYLIRRPVRQKYIVFIEGHKNRCYTHLGPVRGKRHFIHLSSSCTSPRTPAHELFHALGRIHEQNRYDRDRYVQIYWNNIRHHMRSQYRRERHAKTLGLPYDYYSVMHYGVYSHSNGRGPAMRIRNRRVNPRRVGREAWLTNTDIAHIVRRYCGTG